MPEIISDDKNIVVGPDAPNPIPNVTFGRLFYDAFLTNQMCGDILVDCSDTSKGYTSQRILEEACNLAEALRRTNYSSNTVLGIVSENSCEYVVPIVASFFNKSIITPVNPMYTVQELYHCLNITKPRIIFTSSACQAKVVELRHQLKCIEKIIVIDTNVSNIDLNVISLNDFVDSSLNKLRIKSYNFVPMEFDPVKTPGMILYSSGTTGLPKGVVLSHWNMVVTHNLVWLPTFDPENPQASLLFSPFYHSMGLNRLIGTLLSNRISVVMRRFDEDIFLKAIQDYKVQMISVPPPLMLFLAKSPKVDNYDLSSLMVVGCGAAPLDRGTEEEVKKRLNLVSTIQGYGLTEATFGIIMAFPGNEKSGSVGRLLALAKCKVRDMETGKALGPNHQGELCFKSPTIMMGYHNNEEATKETFTEDGWFRSGDIGYYDEEGFFFIVDRLKELIKYKGYQVAPAELEAILLTHKGVRDAGVIGLPDAKVGELPQAFVVKQPASNVSEKELQEYISKSVSPHKRLRGGVIFVSAIPRTATGKIVRREMKNMLNKFKQAKSKL